MDYTTRTVHVVDSFELDKTINDRWPGVEFEFVSLVECGNDTDHDMGNIQPWTDQERRESTDSQWSDYGEFSKVICGQTKSWQSPASYSMPYYFLRELVSQNLIPAGEWLVKVSW
jgi:hypothetical protein